MLLYFCSVEYSIQALSLGLRLSLQALRVVQALLYLQRSVYKLSTWAKLPLYLRLALWPSYILYIRSA